ncbi:MAG: hypothetical protein MJA83_06880, partial [Gammaproteobacteria bacterium]|nr:hypothetical protein [Gammaproteobacteria bacterium]
DKILLADITLSFGTTQILNGDISTSRRQDAFVLSAGALSVNTGTPEESDQAILTELNNHITGVSNLHPALAVDYAGGPAWHDGTTNPAATAEAQFDKIITDLVDAAGSDRIGAAVFAGGVRLQLSAGSIQDQLRAIADATSHDGTNTFTGQLRANSDEANPLQLNSTATGLAQFISFIPGTPSTVIGLNANAANVARVAMSMPSATPFSHRFGGTLDFSEVTENQWEWVRDSNDDVNTLRRKQTGTGATVAGATRHRGQPGRDVAAGNNTDGGPFTVELASPGTGGTTGTGRKGTFDIEALSILDHDGDNIGDVKTKHYVLATDLDDNETITSWYLSPFGALAVGETEIVELTLAANDRPSIDAANNGCVRT